MSKWHLLQRVLIFCQNGDSSISIHVISGHDIYLKHEPCRKYYMPYIQEEYKTIIWICSPSGYDWANCLLKTLINIVIITELEICIYKFGHHDLFNGTSLVWYQMITWIHTFIFSLTRIHIMIWSSFKILKLSSYPGYFWEPHWLSFGAPGNIQGNLTAMKFSCLLTRKYPWSYHLHYQGSANDRRYIVTLSLMGWVHTQNNPWIWQLSGNEEW